MGKEIALLTIEQGKEWKTAVVLCVFVTTYRESVISLVYVAGLWSD